MKAVRKLSTSIHNVGNMITNKISDVKTKGGTQLKLQVICPADGYPGKQITISTPDHQMLSVIIPKRVMPGRPFNIVYNIIFYIYIYIFQLIRFVYSIKLFDVVCV